MEIKAEAKYVRMSPRKIRLVADAIRHLSPQQALARLSAVNKKAAEPLVKVIKSSLANAVNNAKLSEEALEIDRIEIDEGPAFKRWRPVSRGMAHGYAKRTSHITVVLKTSGDVVLTSRPNVSRRRMASKQLEAQIAQDKSKVLKETELPEKRKQSSMVQTKKEAIRKEAPHVRRSDTRSRNAL